MKYKITEKLELTDEHAASSNGIPVLVINGVAFGKSDLLPGTFCSAGYDQLGNHTGNGDDKCFLAGILVRGHGRSLNSNFPSDTYRFIKSFYA